FRQDGEPYGRKNSKWNDANIPAAELEWLQADLKSTDRKTVVFAHQRLDVSNDHGVRNCLEVRRVLQDSGKVSAVLQGHSHQNDLKDIGGIHYCTLVAMVEGTGAENSGYSIMELAEDGVVRLTGFRKQKAYEWSTQ
ncbi:MAG: metallophosphoesterase family protein, partial [Pirellula staleyi]